MTATLSHHHGAPLLRLVRLGCYEHWCMGCGGPHRIEVGARAANGHKIGFDGDIYRPSFDPEMRHTSGASVCAYWLRAGRVHFSADCTHHLAGKVVDLPDYP